MRIYVDDAMLDAWAKEYHNNYTIGGTPIYLVYSFAEYVEMKKKEVA